MNITFYNLNQKFELTIVELVERYYKTKYSSLPMHYESSFISFLQNEICSEVVSYNPLTDEQWSAIYKELEKQRK